MSNMFVSYDLYSPGQNYQKICDRIKSLGNSTRVQQSYWYLSTHLSCEVVAQKIREVMDTNDSLIVVDSSSNDAYWYNIDSSVEKFIQHNWNLKARRVGLI